MNKKLTLSIEGEVIGRAKEYAEHHGRSLSNIVEEYLKSLTTTGKYELADAPDPLVEELAGSVKYKVRKSDKELLTEALMKKHL